MSARNNGADGAPVDGIQGLGKCSSMGRKYLLFGTRIWNKTKKLG